MSPFIKNLTLLMLVYVLTHHQGFGMQSGRFHSELIESLMKNYGKPYVRPDSDPVQVGFRFSPTISILTWNDDRLAWNPEQQGNIKSTYIPLTDDNKAYIWQPELVLNESLDKDSRSFNMETDYVKLFSNGTIYWYTLAMTTSYCQVNVNNFPFDEQICTLTFTTWLYQSTEQAFYIIDDLLKDEIYKIYEVPSGLWDIKITNPHAGNASYDCSTCGNQEQSYIQYTVVMTRSQRAWYFVIYLLPLLVLSGMLALTVELPGKHDVDAPNFGLTCILTLFLSLTFLFTQLPATGPPIIGLYILVLIVEAVLVTLYVSVPKVLRISTKNEQIALADTTRDCNTLTEDTKEGKSKTTVNLRKKCRMTDWIIKRIIRWWTLSIINIAIFVFFSLKIKNNLKQF